MMEMPGKQKSFSPLSFQVFIGLLIFILLVFGLWVVLSPTQGPVFYSQTAPVLGVVISPGMEVVEVEPGGAAEKGGLQPGDKLEKVDGQTVSTPAEATDKTREDIFHDQPVTVTIRRKNQSLDFTLKPAPHQGNPGGPTPTAVPQHFGFF